ncbi:MAG TPA: type IV pilus assembly protein PilM [Acidimicrobiales bacterium]|nr:type IV pilus assembly protein PilM [Acidimicrobiales bacterium]
MTIGLDIGSSAVRAVQFAKSRHGVRRLTHHGEVPLPAGAVVDGDVLEPVVVTTALRELWGQTRLRERAVAVGLASQRVTVRQIDLPELPDPELRDAVRLQAQDQLPIPVDQAVLDHVVVDRYAVGDDRRNVRLLLVAADRDMVERLLFPVTEAKLRPVVVDLDAFALVRSLGATSVEDDVELIVDIGATVTKITVHRQGTPLFVRMVRLGGDGATRQLQKVLELEWDDAEAAKLAASTAMTAGAHLDPDDERARVLHGEVQRILGEIRRSLEFFRAQHPDVTVRRALLSGGTSLAPSLPEQLEAVLELSVVAAAPLQAINPVDGGQGGPPLVPHGGRFLAVAVGLALGSPT